MQSYNTIGRSLKAIFTVCSLLLAATVAGAAPDDNTAPVPVQTIPTQTVPATIETLSTLEPSVTYGLLDPTRPCTGILVDARHLSAVKRCQSPVILVADTEEQKTELYPDPLCLPNAQELQEVGIVRFYHSLSEARKGFIGDNPYIVCAVDCAGPYHGDLRVSKADAKILAELEKTIHYTRTWHVGFLLPEGE